MSAATRSETPAAQAERLRRELEEKTLLIQGIRKDLILAQISLLELNDTILQKETDRADAVSLLGQFEHALEEKVNHIVELDRLLNGKISALQQELAAQQGAYDCVTRDLVQKLDTANREIGATHDLAAGYARDLASTREVLQGATGQLDATKAELAAIRERLRSTEEARAALEREATQMRTSLSWRLTRPFRALRRLFS